MLLIWEYYAHNATDVSVYVLLCYNLQLCWPSK